MKRIMESMVLTALLALPGTVEPCPYSPSPNPPCGAVSKVYVDPGHGGDKAPGNVYKWVDSGTTYEIVEKNVNLHVGIGFAQALADGGIPVMMSRCTDFYPSLGARVVQANDAEAKVFISVHHNGSPVPPASDASEFVADYQEEQSRHWMDDWGATTFGTAVLKLGTLISENVSSQLGISDRGCKFGGGHYPPDVTPCGTKYNPAPESRYYIRACVMPAVMGEGWFMNFQTSAESYVANPTGMEITEINGYIDAFNEYVGFVCGTPVIPGTFSVSGGYRKNVLTWQVYPEPGDGWALSRADNCVGPWETIAFVWGGSPDYTVGGVEYYSYEDGTVEYSHEYHYRLFDVRTYWTEYDAATPGGLPGVIVPGVPQNVSAADLSTPGAPNIRIEWDAVSGAAGYLVYRSVGAGIADCHPNNIQEAIDVLTNEAHDYSPMTGAENHYRVAAYNDVHGELSEQVVISLAGGCDPLAIENVVVNPDLGLCGAELTWSTSWDVECRVEWGPSSDPDLYSTITPAETAHAVTLCGEQGTTVYRIIAEPPECLEYDEVSGSWNLSTCLAEVCEDQISPITATPDYADCTVQLEWTTVVAMECNVTWGINGENQASTAKSLSHSLEVPLTIGGLVTCAVTAQSPCCPLPDTEETQWNYSACSCESHGRSGTLEGSETWTPANGPHLISGVLTIPSMTTLTIKAGTTVTVVGAGSAIKVDGGSLSASGVTFLGNGCGTWAGIQIVNGTGTLTACRISNAAIGVSFSGGTGGGTVTSCRITNPETEGIRINNNATVTADRDTIDCPTTANFVAIHVGSGASGTTVSRCRVYGQNASGSKGILCDKTASLLGNRIQNFNASNGRGIEFNLSDSLAVAVVDNAAGPADTTVILNCRDGIYVGNFSRPKIRRVRIDDTTTAIRVTPAAYANVGLAYDQGGCDVTNTAGKHVHAATRIFGVPDIDAIYNWWGTSNSSLIAGKITAHVNWNPFLTTDPHGFLSRDFEVERVTPGVPAARGNNPNPFRDQTRILYYVPTDGAEVEIQVFNLSGQRVRSFRSESQRSGDGAWTWDGRDSQGSRLAAGIYYYRVRIGEVFSGSRNMLLLK